jgi:hypothetical protein
MAVNSMPPVQASASVEGLSAAQPRIMGRHEGESGDDAARYVVSEETLSGGASPESAEALPTAAWSEPPSASFPELAGAVGENEFWRQRWSALLPAADSSTAMREAAAPLVAGVPAEKSSELVPSDGDTESASQPPPEPEATSEAVNVTTMAALVALLPRLNATGSLAVATPSRPDEAVATRVGSAGSAGDGSLLVRQMSMAMAALVRESAPALLSESATTGLEGRAANGLAAATPAEGTQSLTTLAASVTATRGHEWSALKLESAPSQWGQQLLDTLKERVEMQVNQNIKQAHIRLDPPELGKLELTVRVEGDRLSVQLNASNPALREALLQSSERLRMSLSAQHSGGVDVNVGQGDRQRDQASADEELPILAGRRQRLAAAIPVHPDPVGLNALV